MRRALFLDRDGVINRDHAYVHTIEDFEFIGGIFELARAATERDYALIVVTNQAGIGRGLYAETQFHALTAWMLERFEENGARIAGVYFCPHHPTHGIGTYSRACDCRKPQPGMLLAAQREHDLDLGASLLVGDKWSDIDAGIRAGVGTTLLLRHDGRGHADDEHAGHRARDDSMPQPTAIIRTLAEVEPWLRARESCTCD
jgi:D-glycero-D-manno-heptose 1,7-bisphosphate phosphatase